MRLLGLEQVVDQPGGGVEAHTASLLAGHEPQGDGHVRLSRADGTDHGDVLPVLQVLAAGQGQDLALAQARDGLELELLQGSQHRKACLQHAPLAAVHVALADLVLQQSQQVLLVRLPTLGRLLGELAVVGHDGWQAQLTQHNGQANVDAHHSPPA